jgi:hypothetical protein
MSCVEVGDHGSSPPRRREGLQQPEELQPAGERERLAGVSALGDDHSVDTVIIRMVQLDDHSHRAYLPWPRQYGASSPSALGIALVSHP